MKFLPTILLLLLFSFCIIAQDKSQPDAGIWKDIKPLKSTRVQVEKILGSSIEDDCTSCIYKIAEGKIQVDYSTTPCKSSLEGWNVPPDTVLKLTIIPNEFIEFSDLNLTDKDYEEYDIFYTSEHKLAIGLNKNTGTFYELFDNKVTSIFFEPGETDSDLRCSCYPPYNPISSRYGFHLNYIDENEIKATLDGYHLQRVAYDETSIVNVVIYIGKTETIKKYKTISEKIRNHWKFRDYPPEALRIIYGGKREKFQINSILLPGHYPPPVPEPDNPSEYCLGKAIR